MKYLDPKNDLTFRRIFGEHPKLLISFLNALLPLEEGHEIAQIEYVDSDIIPELPGFKRSIVDVNCTDKTGRRFIVEMQMYWTSAFYKRMLFNAGKAYVKQLKKGRKYSQLQPVYGLSLVNEDFQKTEQMQQQFYHHYQMAHAQNPDETIEGIELVFVELEKFKTVKFSEKRLQVLWLRFLTEINEDTEQAPDELLQEEVIREALERVQESAFTEAELEYYEKYWDSIRVEQIALEEARKKMAELKLSEEEAWEKFYQMELRAEKERQRAEEERKRAEEEKQRAEEEKKRAEKAEKQLAEAETRLNNMVMLLYAGGTSIEEIASALGLKKQAVERIVEARK